MQKVLTAAEMREVDRLTTEKYGIPSIILMENAAHAVARVITEKLGGSVKGRSILILCGKGNNGGDGAALARILWTQGAKISVLMWGDWFESKNDARLNFEILATLRAFTFLHIDSHENLVSAWERIKAGTNIDVIVDAVFGTGLTRPLDDDYSSFLDIARDYTLDRHRSLVVAVDLPSGLNADGLEPVSCPLEADVTVTFSAPKPASVLPPSLAECGEVIVAPIGTPTEVIASSSSQLYLSDQYDCSTWLWTSRFFDGSYKNKRGHSLIIAGSKEFSGAAVLAGNSAMRSGVGLVTLVTPESSKDATASRILPEVMVRGVAETESGAVSEEAFDEIGDLLEKADSIAIGSGLSQNESTRKFVEKIVFDSKVPVVVDADGLNLLSPFQMQKPAREQGLNEQEPPEGGTLNSGTLNMILTPHEGEFMRLLGEGDNHPDAEASPLLGKEGSFKEDRVAAVREFSQKHNVILVLKGERVLIGEPGGKVVVNPTGNSGLGKAGNGDTLTGIIAGFLAQASAMNIDIFKTVVAAVYIAGMAGDVAEKKFGKRVMTASDVRECLADVFASFEIA